MLKLPRANPLILPYSPASMFMSYVASCSCQLLLACLLPRQPATRGQNQAQLRLRDIARRATHCSQAQSTIVCIPALSTGHSTSSPTASLSPMVPQLLRWLIFPPAALSRLPVYSSLTLQHQVCGCGCVYKFAAPLSNSFAQYIAQLSCTLNSLLSRLFCCWGLQDTSSLLLLQGMARTSTCQVRQDACRLVDVLRLLAFKCLEFGAQGWNDAKCLCC